MKGDSAKRRDGGREEDSIHERSDATLARLTRLEARAAQENAHFARQAQAARARLLPLIRRYRAAWERASTAAERREIEDAYLQACRRRAQVDNLLGLLEALRQPAPRDDRSESRHRLRFRLSPSSKPVPLR